MKILDYYKSLGYTGKESSGGDPTKPYNPINNPDGFKNKATRQDSLDVAYQARNTLAYYQNPKFGYNMKKEGISSYELGWLNNLYKNHPAYLEIEEEVKDNIFNYKHTPGNLIHYENWKNANGIKTKQDIVALGNKAEYYLNKKTKDKYPIWDMITPALDLAAPPVLYDRRISPQYTWRGESDFSPGASVKIPYYDPIAVTPWDMLTENQLKTRIKKYGNSGIPDNKIKEISVNTSVSNEPTPFVRRNMPFLSKVPNFETLTRKTLPLIQNSVEPIGLYTNQSNLELLPDNMPKVNLNTNQSIGMRDFYSSAQQQAYMGKPVGRVHDGDSWTELGAEDWNKLYGTKLETKRNGGWLNKYN